MLNLLLGLLELLIFLFDYLVDVLIMHVALLDLILFAQDHGRNTLMDLAKQSVEWIIVRVDLRDFL